MISYSMFVLELTLLAAIQRTFAGATTPERRAVATIPQYVLDYAPVVWLHSDERYYPSDIGAQLQSTEPQVNFTAVSGVPVPLTLDNLDSLNGLGGEAVYLSCVEDFTQDPTWLQGVAPDASGKTNGAVSSVIIVNDHGSGKVDAFYMYFYAYNRGNVVLGKELGDHVGDWEHNMIRFEDGAPQAVWYSQHANGQAFTYGAVEKQGKRPVAYSAEGSHAVYAITGTHDHTIPNLNLPEGLIEDHCDQGKLWDPTLSAYSYAFDASSSTFSPSSENYPVAYLNFVGKWGDDQLPDSDPRQSNFFGFAKYTGGPTGPRDKQLNRTDVCPEGGPPCIVRRILVP